MFPFPSPPHLFDRPVLGHHEASLPIPPPKLDASSPFFPFSPPIFDHEILNDLVLLAPPPQIPPPSPPPPPLSRPNDTPTPENTVAAPPTKAFCRVKKNTVRAYTRVLDTERRRPLRKDRHSKICTAHGTRDRRMRLSVDVARKFFDLQDMLGFDKASKTVDWLLTNSQSSIKELAGCSSPPAHHGASDGSNAKSESSVCEFEVISLSNKHNSPLAAKGTAVVRSRSTSTHLTRSREKRQIARARARERTKEKKVQQIGFEDGGQKKKPAPSLSPFDVAGEEPIEQNVKPSAELGAEEGKPSSCSPDQQKKNSGDPPPAMITAASSPISIFDYNQNIHTCDALSFVHQEHWSMQSSGNIEDQRAFLADVQIQSWLWETFSPCI